LSKDEDDHFADADIKGTPCWNCEKYMLLKNEAEFDGTHMLLTCRQKATLLFTKIWPIPQAQ